MLKQNYTLSAYNNSNNYFSTRVYNMLNHKDRLKVIELCNMWLNHDFKPSTFSMRYHLKEKKIRSILTWFEKEMNRYQKLAA